MLIEIAFSCAAGKRVRSLCNMPWCFHMDKVIMDGGGLKFILPTCITGCRKWQGGYGQRHILSRQFVREIESIRKIKTRLEAFTRIQAAFYRVAGTFK